MKQKLYPINNYEGIYSINKNGKIWSFPKKTGATKHNGKWLIPAKASPGYFTVVLTKNKIKKTFMLHRLLVETFILNPENKKTVNHKDGNKLNNRLSNLEWATYKENIAHANKTGLILRSKEWYEKVRRKLQKLIYKDAENIRELFEFGFSRKEIHKIYNDVDYSKICKIIKNKCYLQKAIV